MTRHPAGSDVKLFEGDPEKRLRAIERKQKLSKLCAAGACIFIVGYLYCIQSSIKATATADPSPVTYVTELRTKKKIYHPGERIEFSYWRESKEDDILVLSLEDWSNLDTLDVYPGPLLGRMVQKGSIKVNTSRQLPLNLSPGRYVLEGWAAPQTERRTLPTRYMSQAFTVAK